MITVEALNGTFTCYDNDWIVKEIQFCGRTFPKRMQSKTKTLINRHEIEC